MKNQIKTLLRNDKINKTKKYRKNNNESKKRSIRQLHKIKTKKDQKGGLYHQTCEEGCGINTDTGECIDEENLNVAKPSLEVFSKFMKEVNEIPQLKYGIKLDSDRKCRMYIWHNDDIMPNNHIHIDYNIEKGSLFTITYTYDLGIEPNSQFDGNGNKICDTKYHFILEKNKDDIIGISVDNLWAEYLETKKNNEEVINNMKSKAEKTINQHKQRLLAHALYEEEKRTQEVLEENKKMQRVNEYPTQIVGPFKSAEKAIDESAMHKSLLDMGESFLTYLVGIMFGEYKRSGEINEKLETEFYKFSSRKPSFGVFLSFMRLLSKEMNDTILSSKFDKSNKYASVSDFVFNFTLLKSVIDEGSDDGFNDAVDTLKKGRNASQNGLMDFFDTFIMIRNIFAHPDEKAGPKDNKRKWPLGEEYYAFINPYMLAALTELVEDFDILSSYKPVIARMLDDKNKKGTFVLEQGGKESEIDMDLSTDDLRFMNTDLRYLLDPDDKLFVKLYYHAIPQLNPEVAKKIIDREKAKAMEPHLKDMIHGKLADDGKIDDMEYLVLRDTAKTSSISDERLFQLIDAVKNQLQIKESVGTPDNKGDIFIEAKSLDTNPRFNPWWLY